MKKRHLVLFGCILSLICLSQLAFAQSKTTAPKPKLEWGEAVKEKVIPISYAGSAKNGDQYFIGSRAKLSWMATILIASYFRYKLVPYIKVYDKNLNFVQDIKINTKMIDGKKNPIDAGGLSLFASAPFSLIKKRPFNFSAFKWGDKYYSICSGAKKDHNMYSMNIDMQSGDLSNMQSILEVPATDENGKKVRGNDFVLDRIYSADSNYMVFISPFRSQGSDYTHFTACCYGKNMKKEWTKDFTLPYSDKVFSVQDKKVSNTGQLLIAGKYWDRKSKDDPGFLSMLKIDKSTGNTIKETKLDFGTDYVNDIELAYDRLGEPMVVGFYRNDRKRGGIDGIYFAKLDEQGKVTSVHKKEFDLDFIKSTLSKAASKRAEKKAAKGKDVDETVSLLFRDMVATHDSGYLAYAESYYVVEVSYTDSRGVTHTEYHHHYDDILCVKFDKDGNVSWMKKIDKQNVYVSGLSYPPLEKDFSAFTVSNGDSYVLFNDQPGNMSNDGKKHAGTFKRDNTTYIVRVTNNGTLERDKLIDQQELDGFSVYSQNAWQVAPNKVFLLAPKAKILTHRSMMGSLTIGAPPKKTSK